MKESVEVGGLQFIPYLSEEELQPVVARMAQEIMRDHGASNPLFVSILNGAFMFTAELARQLDCEFDIAFAKYSSYEVFVVFISDIKSFLSFSKFIL